MTDVSHFAVRWIDPEGHSVNACNWCQHLEFLHANAGRCLFSQCNCPFFTPGPGQTIEAIE